MRRSRSQIKPCPAIDTYLRLPSMELLLLPINTIESVYLFFVWLRNERYSFSLYMTNLRPFGYDAYVVVIRFVCRSALTKLKCLRVNLAFFLRFMEELLTLSFICDSFRRSVWLELCFWSISSWVVLLLFNIIAWSSSLWVNASNTLGFSKISFWI